MTGTGKEIYAHGSMVASRRIGGSFVLVNLADNRMLRLNPTGTEIWGLLDGRDVAGVARALSERFEIDEGAALADALEFLALLESRGLAHRLGEGRKGAC